MAGKSLKMHIDTRGVCTLTLNRRKRANALNGELVGRLVMALDQVRADPDVRLLILSGAGDVFCSGMDLHWVRKMAEADFYLNYDDAEQLARVLDRLAGLDVPTLARVNGPAFGAGIGLIAACDIALAASTARFSFREVRLGLVPAVIAPYIITAVGKRQAQRWILTGMDFDARAAKRAGLVHKRVPPKRLDHAVQREAEKLLLGGPAALLEAKALFACCVAPQSISPQKLAARLAEIRTSPEGREGVHAFIEKRKPDWQL